MACCWTYMWLCTDAGDTFTDQPRKHTKLVGVVFLKTRNVFCLHFKASYVIYPIPNYSWAYSNRTESKNKNNWRCSLVKYPL